VKTVTEDLTRAASEIKAPTLLLWGEEDRATPPEMGRRLQSLIAGSQLVELPGKDHYPFQGDGAHLCAHYVLDFIINAHGNLKPGERH
jgi:pimeloyl-ACP methyl ester carboxylesterase